MKKSANFSADKKRYVKTAQLDVVRKTMRDLRAAIERALERKRSAIARVRSSCDAGRARARAKAKAFRQREMARINAEAAEIRRSAAEACARRRGRVRKLAGDSIQKARARLAEERELTRVVRQVDQRADRQRKRVERKLAAERRQESDDEVRANLSPDLIAVFDRMRKHIRGNAHKSRTEAFTQWVEENPGEVYAILEQESHKALQRLLREEKRLRKTHAPQAARRVAKLLEAVPF